MSKEKTSFIYLNNHLKGLGPTMTEPCADACRRLTIPVIWVRHNLHSKGNVNDGGFFQLFHDEKRTRAVMNYGPGTEIFSGMDVDTDRDHIVFKNRYSAFLANPPDLQNKLKELGREQLLITGIAANVCVESTLRDAMQLDYEVILVSDATIGTDETSCHNTLRNTQLFFGDVQSTTDIIRDISKDQNK
jgi:ureidoacrylate peracid hydrolase